MIENDHSSQSFRDAPPGRMPGKISPPFNYVDTFKSLCERFESGWIKIEPLHSATFNRNGVSVEVLRLDEIDPVISGNKWFKLKYHLAEALRTNRKNIVTFGGSWSNHIVAAAAASQLCGVKAHGIIRGEQPANPSLTLATAKNLGMELRFVSRETFARVTQNHDELLDLYPDAYFIPAGGKGNAGVQGSREILQYASLARYTHIACSIGTGTMFTGLIQSAMPGQRLIGISALKGLKQLDGHYLDAIGQMTNTVEWRIFSEYHFGGYAKKTTVLIDFMNSLFDETGVKTDFVYTGKLFWACTDLVEKKVIPAGSRLLIIHSGGLQGNQSLPAGQLHF